MARTSYIYSGKNWEKLSAGWKITQMRKTLELSRINYGEIVLLRGRASWSSCRREMSKPSPSHVVVLWNAMKRATQQNAHVQTTSHISFPDHGQGYMFKKSWSLWHGRGGRGGLFAWHPINRWLRRRPLKSGLFLYPKMFHSEEIHSPFQATCFFDVNQ